jgi:hypothetical protein
MRSALALADPPAILPRPDLPHAIPWYWRRGYPVPLMKLHPHELASYRADLRRAMAYRKMARLCRASTDPDIRYFYSWWAESAADCYREMRRTRDFGGYGHSCFDL